ncbi:MAG: hypothetical protein P4L46_13310 [Fimbriimonas sp.]|nr:hypothetical protein [Fimbriimonas sp.]
MRTVLSIVVALLLAFGVAAAALPQLARAASPRAVLQGSLFLPWVYSPIAPPTCAAFSHDGSKFAVGGSGGVQLFMASAGVLLKGLSTAAQTICSLRYSPNGAILAVGGISTTNNRAGGVVELWNVDDDTLIASLHTSAGGVFGIAFSRDGTLLADSGFGYANGGTVGLIECWNVATQQPVASIQTEANNVVDSVDFALDGQALAAGGAIYNANGNTPVGGFLGLWSIA